MRILTDADADPALLTDKRVAVVGYGSQGRAHALNLRDSGADVVVGLRPGAQSGDHARADGFRPTPVADAAAGADIVALLAPDETHGAIYRDEIASVLGPGATLLFAHGLAIHYRLIEPRPDLDVVMAAPKGPGRAVRSEYEARRGLPALIAVAQDTSGHARATALSYACALGAGRAAVLETSFAEECEADLFNEQAVLWGAVPELITAGYDTLVHAGFSPEIAYLECVTEVKLLADLLYAKGIAGMREAISNTAEFGALLGGRRMVGEDARAEMRRVLAEVKEGAPVRALLADAAAGYPRLRASRAAAAAHPLEAVGERLRRVLPGPDGRAGSREGG